MSRSLALPALLAVAACTSGGGADAGAYAWQLPPGFPLPLVPADNPMSEAKVALGRRLFHDTRVSFPQTRACATCHVQALGFTTPAARGPGLHQATRHNVMAFAVPGYQPAYTWADPATTTIEAVVASTLVDENEFGGGGHEAEVASRLASDATYARLFEEAFPGAQVSYDLVSRAIASFVRTIASGDSPFDRYQRGETSALSASAVRGMNLYFSERSECYHCHSGFTLSGAVNHQGLAVASLTYSNTGLSDLDGQGTYPHGDQGLIEVTGLPADMGKFKAPSLRNVARTAPYMHDGSIATLREVLEAYLAGGRSALDGGAPSPLCDSLVVGRLNAGPLGEQEKQDLLDFLDALTDEGFLTDRRYARPL